MKRTFVRTLLLATYLLSALSVQAQPSLKDLGIASQEVYRKENRDFSGYQYIDSGEFAGLKVSVFHSTENDDRIIAFRGSDNASNWMFNSTHVACAVCGDGGAAANPERFFEQALANLTSFFDEHKNEHTMVTGHSLGGFLAQFFSKAYGVGGATFNSPALGDYDLRDENAAKNMFERYKSLASSIAHKVFATATSSITESFVLSQDIARSPLELISGLLYSISGCEFEYKKFTNHRLEGDPVSQIFNKWDDSHTKGFHGSMMTHKHNFWNQMYSSGQGTIRLHSMQLFVEHLRAHNCKFNNCHEKDRRSDVRRVAGYFVGIR